MLHMGGIHQTPLHLAAQGGHTGGAGGDSCLGGSATWMGWSLMGGLA